MVKSPIGSVALRVILCCPGDKVVENETSPLESVPWVENSPSKSDTQRSSMLSGLSSLSLTVPEKLIDFSKRPQNPAPGEIR